MLKRLPDCKILKNNEFYRMEKPILDVNRYSQNIRKWNKKELLMFAKEQKLDPFREFIYTIIDILREIRVPYKLFHSSAIFEIKDKSYAIFRHKNKNGNVWFHFSDIFKVRKLDSLVTRVKKFLKETIGEHIESVFKKYEKKILSEFKEEVKDIKAKLGKTRVQFTRMKNFNNMIFHNLMSIKFTIFCPELRVYVNEEVYAKNKDKILKIAEEIAKDLGYLLWSKSPFIEINLKKRRPDLVF